MKKPALPLPRKALAGYADIESRARGVDWRAAVTRIDPWTTGDQREEIQKRLGGIDRSELITVAEACAEEHEINRAEYRTRRDAERAQERINAPVGKIAGDVNSDIRVGG